MVQGDVCTLPRKPPIATSQLHQLCARDVLGKKAAVLDRIEGRARGDRAHLYYDGPVNEYRHLLEHVTLADVVADTAVSLPDAHSTDSA